MNKEEKVDDIIRMLKEIYKIRTEKSKKQQRQS